LRLVPESATHQARLAALKRQPATGRDAGQGRDVAVFDFDPWSTSFGKLWGLPPAEGGSAERHDDGRGPAKGARVAGTKAGR
jgi:hypothetical protein